ncbi:MAG: hypothetical protein P8Y67_15075, partial [Alphaproteobacteria bacterium]
DVGPLHHRRNGEPMCIENIGFFIFISHLLPSHQARFCLKCCPPWVPSSSESAKTALPPSSPRSPFGALENLPIGETRRRYVPLGDAIDKYVEDCAKAIGQTKAQVLKSIKPFDIADNSRHYRGALLLRRL